MSSRMKWLLAGPLLAALITIGPSLAPKGGGAAAEVAPAITPLKLLITLAGVLALAAAALVIWRRMAIAKGVAGSGSHRTLRVRETLRLSARNRLHLVSAGDRLLLVGEGEKGISLLQVDGEEARDEDELPAIAPRVRTPKVAPEDEGAVPRDMILTPVPRLKKGVPEGADFRKLLEQVRAESRT